MKATNKKIITLLMAIILSMASLSSQWGITGHAASLELVGTDKGLRVTPEDSSLFDVTNITPGERLSSIITITNASGNPFDLYLRTARASSAPLSGKPDLLKQIILTLTLNGKEYFSGPMFDSITSTEGISLGNFKSGEVQKLTLSVYLPGVETGNEFQGAGLDTQWIFSAKRTGELPNTGFGINTTLFSILGLLLIILGSIGWYKFKPQKER